MGSIQNPVKITVGDGKVPDNQLPLYATLVNADGTPFTDGLKAKAQIAALANAANAAGETVTPEEFNELVAKVNAVIAALKA